LSEAQGATNRVLWNGSGVATGDYDGDGFPDIFLCRLNGTNALYRNLGRWRFRDVTAESGLARASEFDRAAVFADVSGDGHLDLLIATTGKGVRCFLNNGKGRFWEVSQTVGTLSAFGVSTLALADVNGDGHLDLYACNYRAEDIKDQGRVELQMKDGRSVVPAALTNRLVIQDGQLLQYGEPDVLYLNNGKSGFTPVPWTGGNFLDEDGRPLGRAPLDWGLSAGFRDIDGDLDPDLYVCNDFWTPDRLWLGDGNGGFRAAPRLALRQISGSSMGVDFADLDRDGRMDFLVVEMLSRSQSLRKRQLSPTKLEPTRMGEIDNRPQTLRNTLFQNRGDGTFAEIAYFAGLAASDWSWSPLILDVDLDGYEDVLITAGHVHDLLDADAREAIRSRAGGPNQSRIQNDRLFPALHQPIVAFRNLGGWRFVETTSVWGTDVPGVHHAMAAADFDRDGDLDLVVNNLGSAAGVYRNESMAARVAVRTKGLRPNVQGIGARVTLLGGAVPMQVQEVVSGGRYMAGADPQLVFAAGQAATGMSLEVAWRSGKRTTVQGVQPNCLYEIREPVGTNSLRTPPSVADALSPLFEDVSDKLRHVHKDVEFDDFGRQPLLPRKLSQLGPGVAWYDLNKDGHEDLVIGGGRGGQLAVLHNDGKGRFSPDPNSSMRQAPASGDHTGIVGWKTAAGAPALLVGLSNYEAASSGRAGVFQYEYGTGAVSEAVPGVAGSPGPLALGDVDGDGACELFVGGHSIPGQYPTAESSALYRYQGTRWQRDAAGDTLFKNIGLITGALWSDLTGDGWPELVMASEWGPLRIFRNAKGVLEPWDCPVILATSGTENRSGARDDGWVLSRLSGWWQAVNTGDFDGDGRLDLVAANWGLNSEYRASASEPLRLYFGEFDGRPGLELIETEWDTARSVTAPRRRMAELSVGLPWLASRFSNHRSFSESSVAEVMAGREPKMSHVEVVELGSMVFLNRGEHFEGLLLPREAQFTPAFGVNVADANGDGHEDIFLAQNFFANRPEVSRQDAGRGLWLVGDGQGSFRALSGRESGVAVDGEGRGSAVGDFDEDGRVDLAVGQHGAATKLFHNRTAKPGLRVRLDGPVGNPTGAGAVLRLVHGNLLGPVREIHSGSGHWSQDGSVQVLGFQQPPQQVWVRWPGGRTNLVEVPSGQMEVRIKIGAP
jgi:hypothetical protein